MKEEKQELKFFKPDNVAYWDIFSNLERCLTEAVVARIFEDMLSDIIKNEVAKAIPELPGSVWINRFNSRSQTRFIVQYSEPGYMTGVATGDLTIKTLKFDIVFCGYLCGRKDEKDDKPIAKAVRFVSEIFQKIGWKIDPAAKTTAQ